jgi:RHS repeat-associated protein
MSRRAVNRAFHGVESVPRGTAAGGRGVPRLSGHRLGIDRKSNGTAICSFAFTRDANGNILTSLREDDSCWYYEYDGLQRLTAAEWKDDVGASLYAFAYDYDKVGNRSYLLTNGEATYYSYNAANELTYEHTLGGDQVYYTYDGRGNQTQRKALAGDTTYFEYNAQNLITHIDSTEAGFTPNTFAYNALGQRIRITDSTGTAYYVWDGIRITHEHDGTGALTQRYTYGESPIEGVSDLIDLQALAEAGDPHYFYHFDQVGGIHRLTDGAEATAQSLEFSPYGRTLQETGAAPNRFGFPATYIKLPDLLDDWASPSRISNSKDGRYGSRDPLAFGGGPSSYAYASCAPTRLVDPEGSEDRQAGRGSKTTEGEPCVGCCVDSMLLHGGIRGKGLGPTPYDDAVAWGGWVGYEFGLQVTLRYVKTAKKGVFLCKLGWQEAYRGGAAPEDVKKKIKVAGKEFKEGRFYDVWGMEQQFRKQLVKHGVPVTEVVTPEEKSDLARRGFNLPTFSGWLEEQLRPDKRAGEIRGVTLYDPPGVPAGLFPLPRYQLDLFVTVTSAPEAKCKYRSFTFRARFLMTRDRRGNTVRRFQLAKTLKAGADYKDWHEAQEWSRLPVEERLRMGVFPERSRE